MSQTCAEIVKIVNSSAGKSKADGQLTGWPGCFKYDFDQKRQAASLILLNHEKQAFRRAEPWGFAFITELEEKGVKAKEIEFVIGKEGARPEVEAFVRRLSFLALSNPNLSFHVLETPRGPLARSLYSRSELYVRPQNEIFKDDFDDRTDQDEPGRLEKDFQTFLFGKGLKTSLDERTNERLAIFGEDFFNLKPDRKFKVLREFPTGVFQDTRSIWSRVLPMEFVDIVTLNRYGQLAIIEIKLNNSELHVISQVLNYALFFRAYFKPLMNVLSSKLEAPVKLPFIAYVANNRFHPRFSQILKYYRPDEKGDGFLLKQIVLGHTRTFPCAGETSI